MDYVAEAILKSSFHRSKNSRVYGSGSCVLRSYLPESDIDLVLCADDEPFTSKRVSIFTVFNALCEEVIRTESEMTPHMTIRNVEFINARTKVAHCKVNNLGVDITINQSSSLSTAIFLEEIDRLIASNHLFKKSVLLIKVFTSFNL